MEIDNFMFFSIGVMIGYVAVVVLWGVFYGIDPNVLSDETLDDICKNLTNSTTVNAYTDLDGKLICEIPSYDSTTNIIVRPAGSGDTK